jgi:predicted transcriptional regulator of viral defense system
MTFPSKILEEVTAARRPFSIKELVSKGLTHMQLSRMVADGQLQRPLRGVYRVPFEGEENSGMLEIACISKAVTGAVICSRTAAYLHGMTEGNLDSYIFGIPLSLRYPDPYLLNQTCRFVKWRNSRDFEIGVETISIANTDLAITSRERTLVDVFRYSSYTKRGQNLDLGIDPEAFHDILGRFLGDKEKRPDELALRRIAKEFNVWDELSLVIETNRNAVGRSMTI